MYMTRMRLNTEKRKTRIALTNRNWFHGAVENALGQTDDRKLWRLDKLNGEYYLMIVSKDKPDMSAAVCEFGYPEDPAPWETLEYDKFLSGIEKGSIWYFKLTANPVMESHGVIYNHAGVNNQTKWLMDRAKKNGFSIDENSLGVFNSHWVSFKKRKEQNRRVTLLSVTFEGVMEIEDPDLVRKALVSGIGKGKAYGQGMMTIMKAG